MDSNSFGMTCALSAAFVWAIAMILFKKSGKNVPPLSLNLFKNTVALILLFITLAVLGEGLDTAASFSGNDILILMLSGIIGITIADSLFFYSLNLIGVGLSSILDCLSSPTVILFSFLLLSEKLTLYQYMGGGLVVLAVVVISKHVALGG